MKTILIPGLICGLTIMTVSAHGQTATPLHSYVNPMVGIGNDDQGDTIAGPARPNGSIHPSPETLTGSNAGYDPDAPISGFAQLHTQGSGGKTTYGTFLLSPQVGAPQFDEPAHLSPKADERAAADMYSVRLKRYDTKVEVTPAHYSAIYKISYPSTDQAQLVFDITRKIRGELASDQAEVKLYPEEGKITGHVRAKGYWNPALIDIWFVARVDQKPKAWGVFKKDQALTGETAGTAGADERLGAWWSFDAKNATPVMVKVAVSFTSAEKAESLLAEEIPDWDFDRVRAQTQTLWDKRLQSIELKGLPPSELGRFYSALYHASIQPRDRSRDQPTAQLSQPQLSQPLWDDHYTLWDTYRTLFPLMSILKPADYASNVRSFVHIYDKYGAVDTAIIGGHNYHVGQGGDEVDNVIGEALIRGAKGVDWNAAYRAVRTNAFERRSVRYLSDNYFAVGDKSPEPDNQRAKSGSSTPAFALNDYYASKLAQKAGKPDDAAILMTRSGSWRKVWNPDGQSDGYKGFILPKYPDGTFQDIDPKLGWDGKKHNNVGYYEGTAWIYSYGILHDIDGMVEVMGGRVRFTERLEHALKTDLIDITNEPSFSTPWLFHNVGRPHLSSYWAAEVFKAFTPTAYPGDEDAGAMSSNYVFNRLGLFPKLTTDLYYLHGPRHALSVINLEGGRKFEIVGHNTGGDNLYIQKATLNGQRLNVTTITQGQIMAGGKLDVYMGPKGGVWAVKGAVMTADPDLRVTTSAGDAQTLLAVKALFDTRLATAWPAKLNDWVAVTRGDQAPVCITGYSVSAEATLTWVLQGSKDGKTWQALDQRSKAFDAAHPTHSFVIPKPQALRHYRLKVTSPGEAKLSELELIYGISRTSKKGVVTCTAN